ncbi:HNH endonuclease signature motif containing protein [Priestia megaterium]|uniref:HNH endonuclease signature motif containing protein n=1 Tax=Priestia megaterium TaxID=1404 RepID=UPI002E1DE72D|nr:HNH endonuclease [Priestia megaterium]MED4061693.1 HNH endonuclease [Priestia megaterium]
MFTLSNFYKSKQWTDLLEVLKLERADQNGDVICEYCGKPIIKKYDCIGHHKIALTEANVNDVNISLNPDNIMLVHFRCHNQLHERWGFEKPKQVFVVYGAPCSGKSTWVNSVAGSDDLILDVDKIWECISICDKYHKPNRLKQNVFGIRDCLLEQVKMRVGKWKNAYIIGTYPLKMDRERLADKLGASLIFIEASKDECMSRAVNDEWKKFIDDWFATYSD